MNKKIIYIIGAGRSGTTLLDIILGNNPQLFSAGELNRFPKKNGTCPNLSPDHLSYKFWEVFKINLLDRNKNYQLDELNNLTKKFEYHSGVLKVVLGNTSDNLTKEYYSYLENFFDILSEQVDKEIIIDSSKYPMRAYHLSRLFKENIMFIYIKRNPVDVVQSFAKKDIEQPPKSWFAANLYLFCVNTLCVFILKKIKKNSKVVTITFDDFVGDTANTLSHISKTLNIDLSNSINMINNNSPFVPGYLFDGNRIRMKKEIKMEKKEVAKDKKLSFKDRVTLFVNYLWWR